MFVAEIKKVVGKKTLTEKDMETIRKASLIAALSSNHSWKTYKFLHNYGDPDKSALVLELDYATREGWKNITETDVEEVVNGDFNPYNFSMWLYHAVDEDERDKYSSIFNKLRAELAYGLEPMERT